MFSNDSWRMMNAADQSPSPSSSSSWSRIQDKLFERALVAIPEEIPDRWEKIAAQVPGKSSFEVRRHYDDLVHDVAEIDSGRVELPLYDDESGGSGWASDSRTGQVSFSPRPRQSESERKKGVPWTEEEHRLFLIGLQRYGKGDWRSISRNAVVSRTPTQVASHAQKYFMRLTSGKKDKKRSSIHDITTVDSTTSLTHTNTNTNNSTQNWMGDSLGSQLPYYDEGPSSFGFSM